VLDADVFIKSYRVATMIDSPQYPDATTTIKAELPRDMETLHTGRTTQESASSSPLCFPSTEIPVYIYMLA
jgi:hypothetical protein